MFCQIKRFCGAFPSQGGEPRIRQALSEGFGHLGNQTFLWRFGSEVGGNGARPCRAGCGKISQCFCTSVFCNAATPCPRVPCEARVFECELSAYLVCRIRLTSSRGTGGDLATRLTSPVMFTTKAPTFFCPLGE